MRLRHLLVITATTLVGACSCAASPPRASAPTSEFDITVRISGSATTADKRAVRVATARLEALIVGDIADVSGTAGYQCNRNRPNPPRVIDDLYLRVEFVSGSIAGFSSDGAGGVLASGGPCAVRARSLLPATAQVLVDAADVPRLRRSNLLVPTLTHEMAHALGFGTLWDLKGLVRGGGTGNPRFTGTKATRAWHALGRSGAVPLEASGGSGTADNHWRRSTFGNELMTGYLGSGPYPFSRVSTASLADLGYRVSMTAADPYRLPASVAATASTASTEEPKEQWVELTHGPTMTIG